MEPPYPTLQAVIEDQNFPRADTALRRGRHIDQDDVELYAFLADAQAWLEPYYRRFGLELIRIEDGYFYLLPTRATVLRRKLSAGAMLTGQAMALLRLDPSLVETAGVVQKKQVVEMLANLVGEERLLSALNPRLTRRSAMLDPDRIRTELDKGLRALEEMGFLDRRGDEELRLRTPLLRFADPVRTLADPSAALSEMMARGEIEMDTEVDEEEDEE